LKLRTFTGLDKECTCAGCNTLILARPDVKVVVDMEGWPRKRYHPACKPGTQKEEVKAPSTPTPVAPSPAGPVPVGPTPATPQPQVDPSPIPHPKVETTNAPSLSDNRPWKILKVTISVGDYTSVQAGVADFGKEGESLEQLGTRLVSELTKDVKTELDVVHQVQAGKPLSVATQGAGSTPSTLSPAQAGAPSRGVVGPEMAEVRRQVTVELECDVSAIRTVKKRHAAKQWLKSHGYESFDQVLPTDLGELKGLLTEFESINTSGIISVAPMLEPVFQGSSTGSEASR
jgi:hypothetical protein